VIEARPEVGAAFVADEALATRIVDLSARVGHAVEADIAALVASPALDAGGAARPSAALTDGSTVPRRAADELVVRHDLSSVVELALLALPVAGAMARPLISGYRVAAVGIEAGSGDLVLGANLEFPGTELTSTIHAEGFVALRARRRGRSLETLVVRQARPCAHCRQTLAESAAADDLTLVDTLGHTVRLADLYPWPFQPRALGVAGDTPHAMAWPELTFVVGQPDDADIAGALLEAGAQAHAPYSVAPSAVALRTRDGRLVAAGCVESVAFNPSISAVQAALVELAAARIEPGEIADAWLARLDGATVDPEPGFRSLLRAVAPDARVHVARWATRR
jgi:cytidine deaminase